MTTGSTTLLIAGLTLSVGALPAVIRRRTRWKPNPDILQMALGCAFLIIAFVLPTFAVSFYAAGLAICFLAFMRIMVRKVPHSILADVVLFFGIMFIIIGCTTEVYGPVGGP